jgi:hypothetical protein
MKKMLSLAAMFAVLSYAAPASAELKIGGEAAIRARAEFNAVDPGDATNDDLKYQYRIRLKTSADLGEGYFFKAMMQNEEAGGSWTTVNTTNELNDEAYAIEVSNFYFGRNLKDCSYSIGRLPLNSFNNPIFDLAAYAIPSTGHTFGTIYAVDVPFTTHNFDRLFGANYSRKIGDGTFNGALYVTDNGSTTNSVVNGDGLLNDGYGLHLSYKATVGDVTVEPQALLSLTDINNTVAPQTFGLNATIPSGKSKIGVSAFYTICDDSDANVDYNGYLVRLKGESGNAMAWIDYNETSDDANKVDYDNLFVWAQYKFKMHESATGTFSLTPTVRYRASGLDGTGAAAVSTATGLKDNSQLRAELYATVTF